METAHCYDETNSYDCLQTQLRPETNLRSVQTNLQEPRCSCNHSLINFPREKNLNKDGKFQDIEYAQNSCIHRNTALRPQTLRILLLADMGRHLGFCASIYSPTIILLERRGDSRFKRKIRKHQKIRGKSDLENTLLKITEGSREV